MRRVLIVLAVLVVLALVLDRVAVFLAERAVADRVGRRPGVTSPPGVTFAGFPFLTQVAAGRYDRVDIILPDVVVAGRVHLAPVTAIATGLRAPTGDLLGGRLSQVRAEAVTASATVSFAQLDALLATRAPRGTAIRSGPGARPDELALRVTAPGATATGSLRVTVARGRPRVALIPRSFNGLPSAVPEQLAAAVRVGLTVPDLPFGLALTGVRTGAGGVELDAAGRDVALT